MPEADGRVLRRRPLAVEQLCGDDDWRRKRVARGWREHGNPACADYVRDGPVWASAGVTTGIELALALVEDDLSHAVSMEIARTLALPMLRGAAEPPLSPALNAQSAASRRMREVVAWIGTHLQEGLSADARRRAFARQPTVTPQAYRDGARRHANEAAREQRN